MLISVFYSGLHETYHLLDHKVEPQMSIFCWLVKIGQLDLKLIVPKAVVVLVEHLNYGELTQTGGCTFKDLRFYRNK